MQNQKICLLYMGGTIGMRLDGSGIAQLPTDPDRFLDSFPELTSRYQIDQVTLCNKDSVNITSTDWSALAKAIWDRRRSGYAGFVVVHGTDTMHYTATALAFALGGSPLATPVALTGSLLPLNAEKPDGARNLADACRVVMGNFGEVMIVFGRRVLRGCQTEKTAGVVSNSAAFEMPQREPLGRVLGSGQLSLGMKMVERGRLAESDEDDPYPGGDTLNEVFADRIWPIALRPGLTPSMCEGWLDGRCRGVVLQGFGDGNIPDAPGIGWIDWIREATRRDVPVLLSGPRSGVITQGTTYPPGRAAIEAGAIPTGGMTNTCLHVKLRWTVARAQRQGGPIIPQVREMMQQVWVHEMDPPDEP